MNIKLNKLTQKEKGYLFGVFKGDGYIFHDKKGRQYLVDFYLNSIKDRDIIKSLNVILKKIETNPYNYKDKRYNCMRIRVRSKLFYNFIKTQKIQNNKDFILGFVSGLIDSDGYVNFKKSFIQIVNTDKELLINTHILLKMLNIRSTLRNKTPSRKDKKKAFNLFITFKFIDTNNNSLKIRIGFIKKYSRMEQ